MRHGRAVRSAGRGCSGFEVLMVYKRNMTREEKARSDKKYRSDPANKGKIQARWLLQYHVKKGNIVPQPCAQCGAGKAQAHHPDYSKKVDVEWLCRKCHGAIHRKTHCVNGHEMTPENTGSRSDRNGQRYCIACVRVAQRNYMRAKRAGRRAVAPKCVFCGQPAIGPGKRPHCVDCAYDIEMGSHDDGARFG